jgi:hypothetical protein
MSSSATSDSAEVTAGVLVTTGAQAMGGCRLLSRVPLSLGLPPALTIMVPAHTIMALAPITVPHPTTVPVPITGPAIEASSTFSRREQSLPGVPGYLSGSRQPFQAFGGRA